MRLFQTGPLIRGWLVGQQLQKIGLVENAISVKIEHGRIRTGRDLTPVVVKEQQQIHNEIGPHAFVYACGPI